MDGWGTIPKAERGAKVGVERSFKSLWFLPPNQSVGKIQKRGLNLLIGRRFRFFHALVQTPRRGRLTCPRRTYWTKHGISKGCSVRTF